MDAIHSVAPQSVILLLSFTSKVNVLFSPRSWKDGALVGFFIVISGSDPDRFLALKDNPPFQSFKCIQVLRLQLPQTLKFITRLIYYFKLNPNADKFECCKNIHPQLEWTDLDEIKLGTIKHLWGPELVEYCSVISDKIKQKISEYSLEEAFLYVPRDPPRNLEEDMLKSLNITEKDVERLYADFLEHCFPSFYQTLESFKCYMAKYGFEKNDCRLSKLFRAFNYSRNGYLSFHEFLLGIACMEPSIPHGEFRVKFIFRYYDTDDTGMLSEDSFKKLIMDMYPNTSEKEIKIKMDEALKAIGTTGGKVSSKDFIIAVGSHKFRGTSSLCRSSKPIFNQITRSIVAKSLSRPRSLNALGNALIKRQYNGELGLRQYHSVDYHQLV